MRQSIRTALFVAAATLVGVACSSGSKTISKSDFISKANALCKGFNAEVSSASDNINASDSTAFKKFIVEQAVPIESASVAKLRALGYPKGDKPKLEAIYTQIDAVIVQLKADPSVATSDAFAAKTRKINTGFDAYGLKAECGSGTDATSS